MVVELCRWVVLAVQGIVIKHEGYLTAEPGTFRSPTITEEAEHSKVHGVMEAIHLIFRTEGDIRKLQALKVGDLVVGLQVPTRTATAVLTSKAL